jgi:hypothetical protein
MSIFVSVQLYGYRVFISKFINTNKKTNNVSKKNCHKKILKIYEESSKLTHFGFCLNPHALYLQLCLVSKVKLNRTKY